MPSVDHACRAGAAAVFCLAAVAHAAPETFIVVNVAHAWTPAAVFEQVAKEFPPAPGAATQVGVAAIFSYLHQPPEALAASLREFLQLSAARGIPVVVQLDGEQWWDGRPDLWNWWDPTQPGYDPANRANVEWSGWGPEHALRIAWRNWGRQIRVRPPPNLMSPRYRDACHAEMRRLVPIVVDWWRALPEDRRHLLIGVKVGWESSIGANAFYYPGGNDLADRPEQDDPTTGLRAEDVPARGVAPIGYAAVTTAGLAKSGELQEAPLAEIARRHMADLAQLAHELGVPRDRLFTHGVGWKDGELLYDAALNPHSCPGWSFYRYGREPAKDAAVQAALQRSDAPYWAAVEWLPLGAAGEAGWREAFRNTLGLPRCRYLCIYNWDVVADNADVRSAIRAYIQRAP